VPKAFSRLGVCPAMREAGITNPESQQGKDYCVECCPHDRCIVVEPVVRRNKKAKMEEAMLRAQELRKQGLALREIAKRLHRPFEGEIR